MTRAIQRYFAAAVLTMWSGVLCHLYFSGRIGSYLHPNFHPGVAICGIFLFILAMLMVMAPSHISVGCAAPSYSVWGGIVGCSVLIIPLIVALSFSRDAFGLAAVSNRIYVEDASQLPGGITEPTAPVASATPTTAPAPAKVEDSLPPDAPEIPKNAKGDLMVEMLDLLYAAQEPVIRGNFENQNVEFLGQIYPPKDKSAEGYSYDIVRLFITCCAADARPVAIAVKLKTNPNLPEAAWVKVRGKAVFPLEQGRRRPSLENAEVTPTDAPEDAYIY